MLLADKGGTAHAVARYQLRRNKRMPAILVQQEKGKDKEDGPKHPSWPYRWTMHQCAARLKARLKELAVPTTDQHHTPAFPTPPDNTMHQAQSNGKSIHVFVIARRQEAVRLLAASAAAITTTSAAAAIAAAIRTR